MNGRTGVYNKWPKIAPELSMALGRVQDRLIFRHRKWLKRYQLTFDCTVWEITGCTSDTFYQHFNDQFEEGMTWMNYGEWQIDHIFPLAGVDPTDTEFDTRSLQLSEPSPCLGQEQFHEGSYCFVTTSNTRIPDSWAPRPSPDDPSRSATDALARD